METAAYTGLRAGELTGLKKKDLDTDARTIRVLRTIIDTKGGLREDTPKSKASSRTLRIDRSLNSRLRDFVADLGPNDYVFGSVGRDGERVPLQHNQFQGRVFKPACRALELDITFHDLRHFHASFLADKGFQPLEVAQRLGHERASFTIDLYSHLFEKQSSDMGDRLDRARGIKRLPAEKKKPF